MKSENLTEKENENSQKFPLRITPEVTDKFPFRDLRLYTENFDVAQEMSRKRSEEVAVKNLSRSEYRRGSTAQRSLERLRASGRKIDLNYVPWFRPVWNKVQRF